ncbi:MAG: galactose-1-phosphate uridylyltransferase [Terrimesophilobacter sp.]
MVADSSTTVLPALRKTTRHLADGREIIYFDSSAITGAFPAERTVPDRRALPVITVHSELRLDRLLDEWVIVASHRQSRTYHPPADQCPLCPTTDANHTEIPERDYQVVVFENRFPSLASGTPPLPNHVAGSALTTLRPGVGRCEVVCFTSNHDGAFWRLPAAQARLVVDAWADRTVELGALDGVEQVFPFENHGEEIGVTLAHPHGQIYAYPFVTPRTAKMLETTTRYRDRTGENLFGALLEEARQAPERVIAANELWTAFVPAAARWPYEVQFFPHRQVPDIPALTSAERDAFVEVYLDVTARFAKLFDRPIPYISAWNQAPVHGRDGQWWLHLQLFSIARGPHKLKYLAGSESGMGVFANDVSPERAAADLKAVVL